MSTKFVLFLSVLAAFSTIEIAYSQNGNYDKIVWSAAHRLTFEDFAGTPDEDTLYIENELENLGLAKISKALIMHTKTDKRKAVFYIYAAMDKSMSWIKSGADSASLKHEQGHFDITEIYARILRREIIKATSLFDAKRIYWQVSAEEEHEQREYDKDNSGITDGIDEYWLARIQSRLNELQQYENPEVVVNFN